MIERINAFAARRFGGVGTTAWSFVRIHVWALVFLVATSLVLPARTAHPTLSYAANPQVRSLTLDYNDQRGFAPDPFGKDRFRIAWITGSEGMGAHAFVPNILAEALPQIGGRKVGVAIYNMNAIRVTDIYFALLDAIESKPDMIVVSLNPAWVLYPLAVHQWKELDAKASVQLLTKPTAWPIAASVLSPSDLMWGLAGSAFAPFRDRFYYSNKIHHVIDDLGPLNRSTLKATTAALQPDRTQTVLAMGAAGFWYKYRLKLPNPLAGPNAWAKLLAISNKGQNPLNKMVLRAIASALRESNIPSYVYLAPVNSGWFARSKSIRSTVAGIEQQMQRLNGDFAATNIRYQPLTATRFVSRLHFVDLVHLNRAASMGPYLATQLCSLLAQARHQSMCDPPYAQSSNGAGSPK